MSNASLRAYQRQRQPVTMSRQELKDISFKHIEKAREEIEENAYKDGVLKMMLVAMETLHDQHGFGKQRLQWFYNRVNLKLDCIRKENVTFEDLKAELEGMGVDLSQQPSLNLKEEKS